MMFSAAKKQQFSAAKQTEPTTESSQFIGCGQENTIHQYQCFYSIDISAFSTFENIFDTVISPVGKVFP